MICNFVGWPSESSPYNQGILNKYAPLLQAWCSVSPLNLLKDLLDRSGEMSAVLIFDNSNFPEIVS